MLGYLFILRVLRVPYPHFGGGPSSCHHAMHHVSTGGMGRLGGSHQRTAGLLKTMFQKKELEDLPVVFPKKWRIDIAIKSR